MFNIELPYRVLEISHMDEIRYKIQQPKKLWIFGITSKYYDVAKYYRGFKLVKYFKTKLEVEKFIYDEIKKESSKQIETIVFDSKHNHR